MGWYRGPGMWAYTIIPITVVALITGTYAAVAYTLFMFDPSNPIHVMMVSSARDPNDTKDNLGDWLSGFESGGMGRNEDLRVQLADIPPGPDRKRFRATND